MLAPTHVLLGASLNCTLLFVKRCVQSTCCTLVPTSAKNVCSNSRSLHSCCTHIVPFKSNGIDKLGAQWLSARSCNRCQLNLNMRDVDFSPRAYAAQADKTSPDVTIPVRAYHVGTHTDVEAVHRNFKGPKLLHRDHTTLWLSSPNHPPQHHGSTRPSPPPHPTSSPPPPPPSPPSPQPPPHSQESRSNGVRQQDVGASPGSWSGSGSGQGTRAIVSDGEDGSRVWLAVWSGAGERCILDPRQQHVMVVYSHGSVVFFNARSAEDLDCLQELVLPFVGGLTDHPPTPLGPQSFATEDARLVVRPSLGQVVKKEPDMVVVQRLDDGVRHTMSRLLGQSVALHYYTQQVDKALEVVYQNKRLAGDGGYSGSGDAAATATGTSPQRRSWRAGGGLRDDEALLQVVAGCHRLVIQLMQRLRLLDPKAVDVAWQHDAYWRLWQLLSAEYDLEARYAALERKLAAVQEESRFILDTALSSQYHRLEWAVIGVLALNIATKLAHQLL